MILLFSISLFCGFTQVGHSLFYGKNYQSLIEFDSISTDSHILQTKADSLFDMLQIAFAEESNVVVIKGGENEPCINHYAPLTKDLSCLIPPPATPTRKKSVFHCGKGWQAGDKDIVLERALNWSNNMMFTFRLPNGDLTDIGKYIKETFTEESLFSIPSESESPCDIISAEEAIHSFRTEYWYKQRPVIIRNYQHSIITAESLEEILKHAREEIVGCKLSDSIEFEGVEDVALWRDDDALDDVPDIVKQKLASLSLVVVRAAHEQLKIKDVLSLLARKRATKTSVTAYVEYHRLRPDVDRRILEGLLQVPVENILEPFLEELFIRNGSLKGQPYLWFGDGTTKGMRHFDPFDNILVQVAGSKTFSLSPPASFPEGHLREGFLNAEFEPRRRGNGTGTFSVSRGSLASSTSMVHTIEGNHRKPLMECRVDAGSAIFVPSGWWHEVQSHVGPEIRVTDTSKTTINAAINFWFPPLYAKSFPCSDCKRELSKEYADTVQKFYKTV